MLLSQRSSKISEDLSHSERVKWKKNESSWRLLDQEPVVVVVVVVLLLLLLLLLFLEGDGYGNH